MAKANPPHDLPKSMLADLRKSGLDANDAGKLGMQYSESTGHPGYVIPYADLDRKPNGHYRIRHLGEPPADAKGRAMRYTQPKGSAPRFYYAHFAEVNWKKIAADPTVAVYITEGEKKAACATKCGLPTIGLGGVWNWRASENGGHAIDDFNRFTWAGRKVVVVFDSDARHNTNVQRAQAALADELIKRGAVPYYIELPERK